MTHVTNDAVMGAQELPIQATDLDALRARLGREAVASGVVDVTYAVMPSPVGDLLLASTGRGLVRVAFASEGFDEVLTSLASHVSYRLLSDRRSLDGAMRQMDDYFAGTRTAFDLELDRQLTKGFRAQVQGYLPHIAYGTTESYKVVAEHVGNPRAVRAVGTACATNPLPIVVPCHRVVRSDGGVGQYLGGAATKEQLLAFEREHAEAR